jgi:subtilisin-like proprotein convertase family protein
MTRKHSKVMVGIGVLCFIGTMAIWLVSSGPRAVADADKIPLITETLTESIGTPAQLTGELSSRVRFEGNEGLVQRLAVHLDLVTARPKTVKVYLTSPSGTRVLLADGATSKAARAGRLEGWLGADGLDTTESLAAFAGEPVAGEWILSIEGKAPGRLRTWSLTADVGPNNTMAGWETASEYVGGTNCSCRVASHRQMARGLLGSALLLLGVLAIRRRRRI